METITQLFQSLDFLIEGFSILIAISGLLIALRGYKIAGALIAVGSGLHALGHFLLVHRDLSVDPTAFESLLISTMFPGLLLLTIGVCYLALTLQAPRHGA
jgi:hypothetical protein